MHEDRYDEGDLAAQTGGYDWRRHAIHSYRSQRASFGTFVRGKGFCLD